MWKEPMINQVSKYWVIVIQILSVLVISGCNHKVRTGWPKTILISLGSGGWKSTIKVQQSLSSESSLPALQTAAFLSSILTWWREETSVSLPLLVRVLIPLWGLHLYDFFKPNSFPKASAPNTTPTGAMDSTCEFWGDINIQSIIRMYKTDCQMKNFNSGTKKEYNLCWK